MLKKIAIIGSESTGKSTLAKKLAEYYKTEWVPEFARSYLNSLDRNYNQEDLLKIAKGQLDWESEKEKAAKQILFCDTSLIVIKIWSEHKYGEVNPWVLEQLENNKYNFYLLTNIDIPWEADPQREHPDEEQREYFFKKYKTYLQGKNLPYSVVSGTGNKRINSAMDALKENHIL